MPDLLLLSEIKKVGEKVDRLAAGITPQHHWMLVPTGAPHQYAIACFGCSMMGDGSLVFDCPQADPDEPRLPQGITLPEIPPDGLTPSPEQAH